MARPSLYRVIVAFLLLLCLPLGAVAARATAEVRGLEWAQLNPEYQKVLAPLSQDWPNIEGPRRVKWVEIAKRYPKMTAAEQQRVRSRIKEWASLTPQDRARVRERYRTLKELPPDKRDDIRRKWKQYDALTEQEKHNLRQARPPKTTVKPTRTIDLD